MAIIYATSFEGQTNSESRLTHDGVPVTYINSGVGPRKDANGDGSNWFLNSIGTGIGAFDITLRTPFYIDTPDGPRTPNIKEVYFQAGSAPVAAAPANIFFVEFMFNTIVLISTGHFSGLEQRIVRDHANGGDVLDIGSGTLITDQWSILEGHLYIDPTSGTVDVRVEGSSLGQPSFAGDTTNVATTMNGMQLYCNNARVDDVIVTSPTICIVSGTGNITGTTITGVTSGATADIDDVFDHPDGGQRLFVSNWDGTPWTAGESVTITGHTGAVILAPNADYVNGFEPNSGWTNGAFFYPLYPNANGNSSDYDGSDGNQVDNYLLVNGTGAVTSEEATYVESQNPLENETYGLEDLPTGVIPIAAKVNIWAKRDGVNIPNLVSRWRSGGVDYDSGPVPIFVSSSGPHERYVNNNPNGNAWSESAVSNAEIGSESRS